MISYDKLNSEYSAVISVRLSQTDSKKLTKSGVSYMYVTLHNYFEFKRTMIGQP